MIANAAAPLTAHGGLDRGLGFHGVSSFDAISRRQRRCLPWHEQTRKVLICSSSPGSQTRHARGLVAQAAAIAVRIRAGRDLKPLPSHWRAMVSTERWLMPRSATMFLLECPASTRSKIWR